MRVKRHERWETDRRVKRREMGDRRGKMEDGRRKAGDSIDRGWEMRDRRWTTYSKAGDIGILFLFFYIDERFKQSTDQRTKILVNDNC